MERARTWFHRRTRRGAHAARGFESTAALPRPAPQSQEAFPEQLARRQGAACDRLAQGRRHLQKQVRAARAALGLPDRALVASNEQGERSLARRALRRAFPSAWPRREAERF